MHSTQVHKSILLFTFITEPENILKTPLFCAIGHRKQDDDSIIAQRKTRCDVTEFPETWETPLNGSCLGKTKNCLFLGQYWFSVLIVLINRRQDLNQVVWNLQPLHFAVVAPAIEPHVALRVTVQPSNLMTQVQTTTNLQTMSSLCLAAQNYSENQRCFDTDNRPRAVNTQCL